LFAAGRSRGCELDDGEDEGPVIFGTRSLLDPSPLALKLKFLHLSWKYQIEYHIEDQNEKTYDHGASFTGTAELTRISHLLHMIELLQQTVLLFTPFTLDCMELWMKNNYNVYPLQSETTRDMHISLA
jgi:hypothetical protein